VFEQVTYQEQRAVAIAASEASADLVAATLSIHGVEAATAAVDRAYPALSWVRGYQVVVAEADEGVARRVLADLASDSLEGVHIAPDEQHR
jgi:hypothetical protein